MIHEAEADTPEGHLKRANHLVVVTLKITRTTDTLRNSIKRMIEAYELLFYNVLKELKSRDKIEAVPETIKERVKLVRELVGSSFNKYYRNYNLLKKVVAAEYDSFEEFRKNVTLLTRTKPPIRVKMLDVVNYLEITKEGVIFLREWLDKNE